MEIGSLIAWAALVLTGLVMAFTAAAEVSLATISQSGVRRMIDDGVPRAQAVQMLLDDPPRFVLAFMVLKAAAFISAAGLAIWLLGQSGALPAWAVALVLLVVGALLLVIQLVARALAVRSRERTALRLEPFVRLVATVLAPITAVLRRLTLLVSGQAGESVPENLFLSEDGLRLLMNVSDEPGLIEEDEKEMIASIFELSQTVVREVMVPRIDIVAIEERTPLLQALDIIVDVGHSRIPIYHEHVDNIRGVLYAKDLLPALRDNRQDVAITELMRPAYFVPDSKKVDDLLSELQQLKVHLAIVVDEYGGTAGVVTIEDLLEEIVGEIQDEYDTELPQFVLIGENEYLFDASIGLDEVSKLLGVELPDEVSDTLGGFIFSQLGRVAGVGNTVEYGQLVMEVQSVSGHRIKQVRILDQSVQHDRGDVRT